MSEVPIAALRAVAARLDELKLSYAFLGGSIVGLLLDHPELSSIRPTDDVDVVIEVISRMRYADFEQRLRSYKFDHDMRPGAPRCRWVLGDLTVDIMPVDADYLGLRTDWFKEALESARPIQVVGSTLRVISPVAFVATKYVAFLDRGEGDFYASHDLEDMITVIDGRASIVEEVRASAPSLSRYVAKAIKTLLNTGDFMDALPGHLPGDFASQRRSLGLKNKLTQIADLAD